MANSKQEECEAVCQRVYDDTRAVYTNAQPQLGANDFGFKILNGAPLVSPPVLFLGFQPSGDSDDRDFFEERGAHQSWPGHLEYIDDNLQGEYQLLYEAQRIALWNRIRNGVFQGNDAALATCVAMNAVFFRAPSIRDWNTVNGDLRRQLEQHSIQRTEQILSCVAPQSIVIIGFRTEQLLRQRNPDLFCTALEDGLPRQNNGYLTRRTKMRCGEKQVETLVVLHLTGAWIAAVHRSQINAEIRRHAGIVEVPDIAQ